MLTTSKLSTKPINRTFQTGIPVIQPTLKIGKPNDKYEQQADRVADSVINMPGQPLQMQPLEEEEEIQMTHKDSSSIQMAPSGMGDRQPGFAPAGVSKQIISQKGNGRKMPSHLNREMSQKIGADFSDVSIHKGKEAASLNNKIGASAFTHGKDIYFNSGEYNPATSKGKHLLAHELAHVVQQGHQNIFKSRSKGISLTSIDPELIMRTPNGFVETSEGVEEIEGTEIESSVRSIRERLLIGEQTINNQIDEWARENFNHVASSLDSAAESFENWYQLNATSDSPGFVFDVLSAGLGILGAAYPPAGLATAILGAVVSITKTASDAQDQARRGNQANAAVLVEQAIINKARSLRNSSSGFGSSLKQEGERVWNNIGLALTMNDPNMVPIAKQELYRGAGLPSLDQDFTEPVLTNMIQTYMHWERTTSLENSTLFVSSQDIEWAILSESQRHQRAREQAQSQLGE